METFQSRLKQALQIKGMKQTDLANLMGTGRSTVNQWVNGRNGVNSATAYKIAMKLNIDPAWIIGGDVPYSTFYASDKKAREESQTDVIIDKLNKLDEKQLSAVIGYIDALINLNK